MNDSINQPCTQSSHACIVLRPLLLAAANAGGGIFVDGNARLKLQHCLVTGNTAPFGFGGGLDLDGTGTCSIAFTSVGSANRYVSFAYPTC
jgi:hypothetical protein